MLYLHIATTGEVSVSGIEAYSVTPKGSLFYVANDFSSPDRSVYATKDGEDVTSVKAIRKHGLVEVSLNSSYLYSKDGETQVLGTLPSDMCPAQEKTELISYGEDKYSLKHFVFSDYYLESYQFGSGADGRGNIKDGSRYLYFRFILEEPLNYDIAVYPYHSNGKLVNEEDKNGNKIYYTSDFIPIVIPKGSTQFNKMVMCNYKQANIGKTYYISLECKALGYSYEQLLSTPVTVID